MTPHEQALIAAALRWHATRDDPNATTRDNAELDLYRTTETLIRQEPPC